MRIVIAEDAILLREGIAELLESTGHIVVGRVGDAASLLDRVTEYEPDLAIVDVRMPPNYDLEGVVAAQSIRARHPAIGVLLLSQHIESRVPAELLASGGFGYLLKDRVLHVSDFLDAATRVAQGGTALDPQVVVALMDSGARRDPLSVLTARERDVLALMAEGLTNHGIANRLFLTENTVESHVRSILRKLDLLGGYGENRRVRAVVEYLRASGPLPTTT
jgi:DNA-binding NarL/FixJ family response regulator